jgi:hypothetical protein
MATKYSGVVLVSQKAFFKKDTNWQNQKLVKTGRESTFNALLMGASEE